MQSLDRVSNRKFKNKLSKPDFKRPQADIGENNYWTTGGRFRIWEYDKKTGKLSDQIERELCLGLINFHVNQLKSCTSTNALVAK